MFQYWPLPACVRTSAVRNSHAVRVLQYETLVDQRIVVAIDSWEADSMYPAGHYTRTLGPIGDRDTETEVRCGLRRPKTLVMTGTWRLRSAASPRTLNPVGSRDR